VRPACLILCLFLIAPPGLAGQNVSYGVVGRDSTTLVGPDGRTIPTTTIATPPNLCPVSIQASHLADGNIVKTGANRPEGGGQRLHLYLHSPDQRKIVSATVNLHGWTAKGRIAQVGSSETAALVLRTLTVPFTPGADRAASADVWVPGLTAVVSVELLSVKYSDGSTWTPPQGKTCRVAPETLMLVTQR
jgi:hypothetical protein